MIIHTVHGWLCAGAMTAAVMGLTPAAVAQGAPAASQVPVGAQAPVVARAPASPAAPGQGPAQGAPAQGAPAQGAPAQGTPAQGAVPQAPAVAAAAPAGPPAAAIEPASDAGQGIGAAASQAAAQGQAPAQGQGAAQGTPLSLRPSPSPLGLGNAGGGSWTTQAGLVVLALAGGIWLYKRRGKAQVEPRKPPKILARTAVGVRSELLVVEVEGQTMLLGVTPTSIQRIAILPGEDGSAMELREADAGVEPGFQSAMQRTASGARELREAEDEAFERAERAAASAAARSAGVTLQARSASALRALTPPQGNIPVKSRSGKGGDAGDGVPRSNTLRGLGMSEVEEQARGLMDVRSRS